MKIRSILVSMAVLLAVVFGCAKNNTDEITILHTNDMHSQYIPMPATWVDTQPKPMVGGMVAVDYFVKQNRAKYPKSLLLDAGDFMTGTPLSTIMVDSALGGAFVKMMNIVGYDGYTIGNHEFDQGQHNLYKLIDLMDFDVIDANLFINDQLVADNPYYIYKVGNLRVGVIGLTLPELFQVTAPKNLKGVRIDDPAETAQKYINEIDSKTDIIILLTHNGIESDEALASKIKNADIIIGGHSHTRLPKPKIVNGVIICQAGSKTRNLGRMTIQAAGDTVTSFDYELIDTWVDSVKNPNSELVKMVNSYQEEIDKEFNEVIGTLKNDWRSDQEGETNIGDFISDAIRSAANSDFAIMNNGGIRKDLPAGPITRLDIFEILPFTNYVETFTATGSQVLQLIESNIMATEKGDGALQVSGLKYSYKLQSGKPDIISATINGQPVVPEKLYIGATVDFILDGQTEKYFGFIPEKTEKTGLLVSELVSDYIVKTKVIESKIEGRMTKVK